MLLGCPSFPLLLSPPHLFTIATELKYKKMERKKNRRELNKSYNSQCFIFLFLYASHWLPYTLDVGRAGRRLLSIRTNASSQGVANASEIIR